MPFLGIVFQLRAVKTTSGLLAVADAAQEQVNVERRCFYDGFPLQERDEEETERLEREREETACMF